MDPSAAVLAAPSRRRLLATALGLSGLQPPALSSNLETPPFAVFVLGRLGYGHRPGSLYGVDHFLSLGGDDGTRLAAFVDEQLNPPRDAQGNVLDPEVDARLADPEFETLGKDFDSLWLDYEVNGRPPGGTDNRSRPIREGERVVFVRAIHARWQLFERMADFWHNHFNVYGYDRYTQSIWSSWDRDVIRRHALGNFRALLQATFESPAMLYFLDNYVNRAPSFNENYAREILELHTLGAINYLGPELQQSQVPLIPPGEDGAGLPIGYVDADVYELARAFTGWRFGDGNSGSAYDGHLAFRSDWHDIGQKTVLGTFVAANPVPEEERQAFLDAIAFHPGTARHVALKLARRFVGEDPPEALVNHVAHVFFTNRQAPDQIAQTLRALFLHDVGPGSFADRANFGNKLKTPFELVASALRAVGFDYTLRPGDSLSDSFMSRFNRSGHRPFYWRSPDGYSDVSSDWMNGVAFVHAWRTIDWVLDQGTGSGQTPMAPVLATTLQSHSAQPQDHTANLLAEFWLQRCFGWAPDPVTGWTGSWLHRRVRDFMCRHTDTISMFDPDVGIGAGPAGNTDGIDTDRSPNWWHSRLRGMINCILFSPQFLVR